MLQKLTAATGAAPITVERETLDDVKTRLERESEPETPATAVSPTTSTTANNGDDSDEVEKCAPLPSLKLSTGSSLTSSRTTRVNSTDDSIELWDENEAGLSWGEKRGRDGTWEERWLQQKTTKREAGEIAGDIQETNIVFGRSSGINTQLRQRWTASWETRTRPTSGRSIKTVKKVVHEYDAKMEQPTEEWNELIREERRVPTSSDASQWTRRLQVVKTGQDERTGRQWTDTRTEIYQQPDSESDEVLIEVSEEFVEILGTKKSTRRSTRGSYFESDSNREVLVTDGCTFTSVHMESEDNGNRVSLVEESTKFPDGKEMGERSGTTAEGKLWRTTWEKQPNGAEETREWSRTLDGKVRERRTEKRADGETHELRYLVLYINVTIPFREEHWEQQPGTTNRSTFIERTHFIDKWWTKPSGDSWGEKELTVETVDGESARPTASHTVHEKWYNNTKEKVVDNWKTDLEYGSDGAIVSKTEYGYTHGDRYTDGTEWGERWQRVSERASWVPVEDQGDHSESQPEELHLRLRQHDRWWKEPSGNRWGEKRYVDLKDGVERNENWYNNGEEEQVDRWEILPGGQRSGEKFGRRSGGRCEWKESWAKSSDSGDFWIDKHWKEYQDSGKWGEREGREGGKQWRQKWGEDQDPSTNTGHRWFENWDDDGFGNFQTHKEGSNWVEGHTVAWFSDKYGECLGRSEKWAVKEGGTAEGNRWVEKWNETPQEKSAEKRGVNSEGDEWREAWNEKRIGETQVKWAEKTGKNRKGEEWMETWLEEDDFKKQAKKVGKNPWSEWSEEWGEDIKPDGSGEKWASKWSRDRATGHSQGQNWGDRWGPQGIGGHRWGEKWTDDHVDKWWHDTPGRPEGC